MMSAPLKNITNAMNMMLSSWTSLDSSTSGGLDIGDVESIRSELNRATQALDEMGKGQEKFNNKVTTGSNLVSKLATKVAGMVGAFVGFNAIRQVATEAVNFASDLAEVQNVVDVAFGESSKVIDAWSETTLNAFGLNELSAKQFAGTMGAMLKSSGLTGDAVTQMSMKITELAGDMASFYNLDGAEAFNKLRAGISGETEPLKQLGINMSVANLEAYAMSQGIKTAFNDMSQAQQVMLRYNYLLQATADAQGDFTRTSDSFSNQQKLLTENWKAFTGELAGAVIPILTAGLSTLNSAISFMANNWSILRPIILGVVAALALVNAKMIAQAGLWVWNTVIVGGYNAVIGFLSHGFKVLTSATYRNSAAQLMYNNALLACPLTWILLIIIAVIAAFYAVIAVINKTRDTTISATGIILGALTGAVSVIWNLFLTLVSLIIQNAILPITTAWDNFANFFGNLFNDPIGAIIHSFETLANSVLGILKTIANGIDSIFGSNLAGTVQGWMDSVSGKATELANKYGNGTYEQKSNLTGQLQGLLSDAQVKLSWQTSDAYNTGYSWGETAEDKISGFFNGGAFNGGSTENYEELLAGMDGLPTFDELATNTSDIKDSLEITNENLKYLRDAAEQEVINRFTTAEIRVEMGGINNTVNQNTDIDGVIDYMVTGVEEAMQRVAEGVHS